MANIKLSWTVKLSIIGLLLLLINFFVIGGGHGYFELLFITFPYSCLLLNIFDEINLSCIFLFLIQYPIYGYFLDKKQIDSFVSRLTWQAHFIQKFEMEEIMEFESVNKGFHSLKKKVNQRSSL